MAPQTFGNGTIAVGGVPFTITSFSEAARLLAKPWPAGSGCAVRLANAFCVATASIDVRYETLLNGDGINLPDGWPVYWIMRLKCGYERVRPERIRGPSLFKEVLRLSQAEDGSHFFLGGSKETLELLQLRVRDAYPGIVIAGVYSPPFVSPSSETLEVWADLIKASGATIAWIGLGSPKQDFVSQTLACLSGIPCIGVGAAFDFTAGTQPEAPVFMQQCGLEWIFRLRSEPRRLWRRYLFGNLHFLAVVGRAELARGNLKDRMYRRTLLRCTRRRRTNA